MASKLFRITNALCLFAHPRQTGLQSPFL
jgi:hypothetical protein